MKTTARRPASHWLMLILVAGAALTRLLPHPANFTAVGAVALLGGSMLSNRRLALLVPLLILLVTDLVLGFHVSMLPVYACFALTVWIGTRLPGRPGPWPVAAGALSSSVIFFLVTNLPLWYADLSLYPLTWQGTLQSYAAALPFFGNQVAGDLIYSAVLFGLYSLLEGRKAVVVSR
jgi:hypothetical protein